MKEKDSRQEEKANKDLQEALKKMRQRAKSKQKPIKKGGEKDEGFFRQAKS